ncbi:MAG: chromate transporter [Oscillospiraceae bacterium]|nr:chromate transporter [Oscillospiraceae bacterium]
MKNLLLQYRTWFKIGLFTFGGGYVILPMIDKEIVQKYHWVENEEVVDYYAIGQSLPGIIAVNTAAFVGYKNSGVKGAIASVLGVISPSILLITLIATLLTGFQDIPAVRHALAGIKIGVCMLMMTTIIQLWKGSVKDIAGIIICLGTFALAYFAGVSMVVLVLLAAVTGIVIKAFSEKRKAKADTKE